jgi:hypothetical protein
LLLSLLFWRRGTMWKWSDDMSTGSKDFHQCIHHEMYLFDVKREQWRNTLFSCRVRLVHTGNSPFYNKANYVGKDDWNDPNQRCLIGNNYFTVKMYKLLYSKDVRIVI